MVSLKKTSAGNSTTIRFGLADSPLGRMLLAATVKGICSLRFDDDDQALENNLHGEHPGAQFERNDAALRSWMDDIVLHLEGGKPYLRLPLDVRGTEFQQRVWRELQAIPYGSTKSYGEVARAIGRPKAVRAVGQACGRNPVAVVVPCHRVLRGHGELGGFALGLQRKQFLLDTEKKAVILKTSKNRGRVHSSSP
jgi:AraC family transcriptional regulator, regulatory protein of adaptative response / methylated-DNA-[protein]-cysteine methyltransferase